MLPYCGSFPHSISCIYYYNFIVFVNMCDLSSSHFVNIAQNFPTYFPIYSTFKLFSLLLRMQRI